jgi:lysophospholipase L1-like esterase
MTFLSNSFKFSLIFFLLHFGYSQEYDNRWSEEIDAFEILNGESPMQEGILFTGSSSIRFWKDPVEDFNNDKILNRGFGGSQIIDLIENFDQIILKYHPKKIVIYSGDNDVDIGKSAEIVYGDFCTLFGMIKAELPDAEVVYIAIKPSISRWDKVLEMSKTNTMIYEFLNKQGNGTFVDIFSLMIDLDGKPIKALFVEDGLHMSEEGYQLWTKILLPYIND